jgi:pimeloyl-ACP methyl ester carboxylesterase
MSYKTEYARLRDGISLPYIEKGEAAGTPVIFLHGVTDSHRSFELLFPHLPESMRAIAVTQRGHGDAPRLDAEYRPREFADDLSEFMDTAGIDKAVIVGHSMGSFVGQRFAIDYPERVIGLVLIGSFTTCRYNDGVVDFVTSAIDDLSDPIPSEFAREFQTSTFAKPIPDEFLETVIAESVKVPARIWKAACHSMIDTDHTGELGKIKAETLLIWGDQDAYFDLEEQKKLLEGIERSTLNIYKGVGHTPQWEVPERLAADLIEFIDRVAPQHLAGRGAARAERATAL